MITVSHFLMDFMNFTSTQRIQTQQTVVKHLDLCYHISTIIKILWFVLLAFTPQNHFEVD